MYTCMYIYHTYAHTHLLTNSLNHIYVYIRACLLVCGCLSTRDRQMKSLCGHHFGFDCMVLSE